MAFTIPNENAALPQAQREAQSAVDAVDLNIIAQGVMGEGVMGSAGAGLVEAQTSPNATVKVAAGHVRVGSTVVAIAAGNVTCTNDPTNPRFYLVQCSNSGAIDAKAGTPHSTNPVFPTVDTNKVALATVYVAAGDTTVEADKIVDKRMFVGRQFSFTMGVSGQVADGNEQSPYHYPMPFDMIGTKMQISCVTSPTVNRTINLRRSTDQGSSFSNVTGWQDVMENTGIRVFAADTTDTLFKKGELFNFGVAFGGSGGTDFLIQVIGEIA
jgi:hypothetical protein